MGIGSGCDVVLKWWSVLDAHKTRAARDGSNSGVALCDVCDNDCTQWECTGQTGGQRSMEVGCEWCECVGTQDNGQQTELVGCVELWRTG